MVKEFMEAYDDLSKLWEDGKEETKDQKVIDKQVIDKLLGELDNKEDMDSKIVVKLLDELHRIEEEEGWKITDQNLIDEFIDDAYAFYTDDDVEGALAAAFADLGPEIEADLKANGYALPESLQEAVAVNKGIQEQINKLLDDRMEDWRGLAMEDEDEDEDGDPDAYAEGRMSDYANDIEAFIDDYDVLSHVKCTRQEAIDAIENWLEENNYK